MQVFDRCIKPDGGKFNFVDYFSPTCVPVVFLDKLAQYV